MIIASDVGITIVNRELLCKFWHIIITTWWCVYYLKPRNVKEWSSWLQKYSINIWFDIRKLQIQYQIRAREPITS